MRLDLNPSLCALLYSTSPRETSMSGNPASRWFYPWVPIGMATGLAVVIGWLLLRLDSRPAQAAEAAFEAPAGIQTTTQKALVAVTLPNPPHRKLHETL